MTSQDRLGLRTEAPRLEPDEAFLQRLSQLAAASAPAAAGPRVARSGLAIGLAAASVAVVVGGAAWAGGVIGDSDPNPPAPADTGGTETGEPTPDEADDATPLSPGASEDAGDPDDRATGERGDQGEGRVGSSRDDDPATTDDDTGPGQAGQHGQGDPGRPDDPGSRGDQGGHQAEQDDQDDQDDQDGDKPGLGPGKHPGNPHPGSPPSAHPGNPNPGTPPGAGHPGGSQGDQDDDDQGGDRDQG